ncbi:hypothetical protein [Jiulongibacter sp. NS-SX5]|uniref:hypothetical protein n=1 Tax=Jiulongibacter sp. NS-SX5 TaxID=3463854 RepID=UPI00405A2DBA
MNKNYSFVGAGTLIGMGVGFFLSSYSPYAFLACMFTGIGLGMLAGNIWGAKDEDDF